MNIKMTEYIGASTIALSVKDVPMTALPGIKDAFVRLCETVETSWEPSRVTFSGGHEVIIVSSETQEAVKGMVSALQPEPTLFPASTDAQIPVKVAAAAEVTQPVVRRGRPRKTEEPKELPAASEEPKEDKEPVGEIAESKSPGTPTLPESTLLETVNSATPQNVSRTGETSTIVTPQESVPSTGEPAAPLSEITDSELQKYCAKLAAHFGDPKKVFDLAQPFVPEGAVARPTNIKDNAQRHAFIQAAEAASGVKYHG
jgi:cell pole-organizing protein PopZ